VSCEEARQYLPDYALGTLSDTEDAGVRRHIRGCSACRSEAASLDQGVTLFARATHAAEPPADLRERVLSALGEEWAEEAPPPSRRPQFSVRWQYAAAILVVLAGVATWAGVAQYHANRFSVDAAAYRRFLGELGGKDIRAGALAPAPGITMDGSVVMYDSDRAQSWVLVLARAPGSTEELTVQLENNRGNHITVPFPLQFNQDGEGWTGMVTGVDISSYRHVVLTDSTGAQVAEATLPPLEADDING
jgi:Putative zinc-finger